MSTPVNPNSFYLLPSFRTKREEHLLRVANNVSLLKRNLYDQSSFWLDLLFSSQSALELCCQRKTRKLKFKGPLSRISLLTKSWINVVPLLVFMEAPGLSYIMFKGLGRGEGYGSRSFCFAGRFLTTPCRGYLSLVLRGKNVVYF